MQSGTRLESSCLLLQCRTYFFLFFFFVSYLLRSSILHRSSSPSAPSSTKEEEDREDGRLPAATRLLLNSTIQSFEVRNRFRTICFLHWPIVKLNKEAPSLLVFDRARFLAKGQLQSANSENGVLSLSCRTCLRATDVHAPVRKYEDTFG